MTQPPRDDRFVRLEEEAAAIGGGLPDYDADEAHRPLEEAGEGVEEGFELAEAELREAAEHGDGRVSPELDAFTPELESDRSTAVYGEPDELHPTEWVEDPSEGLDDPAG